MNKISQDVCRASKIATGFTPLALLTALLTACGGSGSGGASSFTAPAFTSDGVSIATSGSSLSQKLNHSIGGSPARAAALPLGPLSSIDDPANLLGANRVIDNPYQPDNRDANSPFPLIRIAGLEGKPFPTGKWYKGFFYQVPASLTSNFNDAPPWDSTSANNGKNSTGQEAVFAYPNRLTLDDRIPMVSAAFPRPRYIAPSFDPDAGVYKLKNRFVSDEVLYPIVASALSDLQLAASTGRDTSLTRSILQQDELTVTTRWQSADANRQMDLIAAVGSPYVTVRYKGIAPVIGVGQGITQRFAKDPATHLPLQRDSTNPADKNRLDPNTGRPFQEAIPDYRNWESVNGLVAVAAGTGDLSAVPSQTFVEASGDAAAVKTPDLTGTSFRFVYRVPDPSRPSTPRTNNNAPPAEPLINRVMNLYASSPITLKWDGPSRTYVASAAFSGVLRAAFVGEAVIADISSDRPETLRFDAIEQLLFAYCTEMPTSGHVIVQYDGSQSANVKFSWDTANIKTGKSPNSANLLMMAFDATQTPSLQGATQAALGYTSNFGRMSGIVGGEWTQAIPVPGILQTLPEGQNGKLWYGSGDIKVADRARVAQELSREATDTQTFIRHCNYDSYNCGKYIAQLGRLALIADQLGMASLRGDLVKFMKQNLNPWFDGSDPTDPDFERKIDPKDPIFDYFIYDRTNKGLVTFRPYNRRDYTDDYYNLIYTDHMFHYGYFIYASAVIAKLDEDPGKAWLNKYAPFVDLLVRDIANPSPQDNYFPVIRTFDWFRMQNLANAGPTANGGNTESSSESINSDYALALWGDATGDADLKALAAVLTASEIRTAQAFYQVTPGTSVFRQNGDLPAVMPVTVTVQTATGTGERVLDANDVVTRGIVWSHITENSLFFGPRKAYLVGIQVLPVTPISEYVLGKAWARENSAKLQALEDQLTANYTLAISNVPGPDAECAVFAMKTPPEADPPNTFNWGGGCAAAARKENAWRQVLVSANGINDPAGTYDRFVGIVDRSIEQSNYYTQVLSNPRVNPGSSTDANGSLPDLIRQTDTPSSNTNVLWWLSMLKP